MRFGRYGKGGGGDNCGVGCTVAAVKSRSFDGGAGLCIIAVGVRNYVAVGVLPFYEGVGGVGGVAVGGFGGGVAAQHVNRIGDISDGACANGNFDVAVGLVVKDCIFYCTW